jgi:hypothetical protein
VHLLFFPPETVLLDLVQQLLLVGEQVGDARVLLELAPPFWVLLGELLRLALLVGRCLFDLVPQPGRRPLGLWLCEGISGLEGSGRDRVVNALFGLFIEPAIVEKLDFYVLMVRLQQPPDCWALKKLLWLQRLKNLCHGSPPR